MAPAKTWSTKEEVLRDLAKATGRKVGGLDEEYLVIGARPPPRHIKEDDDEMQLLFGDTLTGKPTQTIEKQPDLRGITQMLRMVNDYDGEDESVIGDIPSHKETIITISKLNPNVKEFIPNSATSSSPTVSESKVINNNKETSNDKTDIIDVSRNDSRKKSIEEEKLIYDDVKAMADELKSKISDASKSETYENKKRKNVAIATLLKLYATKLPNRVQKKKENQNGVKLMTPQDFEVAKNVDCNNLNTIASETLITESNSLPSTSTSSGTPVHSNKIIATNGTPSSTPVQTGSSTTEGSPCRSSDSINPEVKASIDKVKKWLDEPELKKKSAKPAIFLGPVAFKRKDGSVKSLVSDSERKTPVSPATVGQYVPSSYAAVLGKKYMERSEAKKNAQRNAWTNLDEILKERDAKILEKRKNGASSSNSQMSTTPIEQ